MRRQIQTTQQVAFGSFTSELAAMQADGADRFVEFGPGKTLTGLVKKTLKDVTAVNVENADTLASL